MSMYRESPSGCMDVPAYASVFVYVSLSHVCIHVSVHVQQYLYVSTSLCPSATFAMLQHL